MFSMILKCNLMTLTLWLHRYRLWPCDVRSLTLWPQSSDTDFIALTLWCQISEPVTSELSSCDFRALTLWRKASHPVTSEVSDSCSLLKHELITSTTILLKWSLCFFCGVLGTWPQPSPPKGCLLVPTYWLSIWVYRFWTSPVETGSSVSVIWNECVVGFYSGLLYSRNSGLHRSGGLHANRLHAPLWLVVTWGHHVRDAYR